jgi:hypothetical protein
LLPPFHIGLMVIHFGKASAFRRNAYFPPFCT